MYGFGMNDDLVNFRLFLAIFDALFKASWHHT
jgi:hypothetical protein